MIRLSCTVAIAVSACRTAPEVRAPDNSEATLRSLTQQMLDAVTNGDPSVWDRYVDPDIVYISEAGDIETKKSLLDQIKPLPAGITGTLAIAKFVARVHGDTAVVLHVDDEHENFFGHPIHSTYMQTATWRFGARGWTMIGSQVYASLVEPPTIELPADQLDDYVGSYALTDAISYTITRDGTALVGQRTGGKPQPLKVEVRDVLFVAGQPRSRKIFLRDAHGHIDRMADRREGRDVVWQRR